MKAHVGPGLLGAAVAFSAALVSAPAWGREGLPVVIENSAAISTDIAKAQGVQQPFGVPQSCNWNLGTCSVSMPVPASMRLVIEFVTASCGGSSPSPSVFSARLTTTVGPNTAANYELRLHQQALVSELVKIYADPATTVTFTAFSQNQFGGCSISLSGQLVSVP